MSPDRCSGVLLHITSLPGAHGSGDLGENARHFVDWLAAARQSVWQFLPLGPTGLGHSPYMSPSAFAGNPLLVDLGALHAAGWLEADELQPPPGLPAQRVDFDRVAPWRMQRLRLAAQRFARRADTRVRAELAAFAAEQAHWLDDYALFMALQDRHAGRLWSDWPAPLAQRDPSALAQARDEFAQDVAFWVFVQWSFFGQLAALRDYARRRGVRLMGDVPFYVALHSADVWGHPHLFQLDERGRPLAVAGVPPDAFSASGQRWGNPLYRWPAHAAEGYAWWIARFRAVFAQVDRVRIDHFRGFESCWEIPADCPDATRGRWVTSPGAALFDAVQDALGSPAVIAEDLGVITPEVDALRRRLGFPGMRVLQFAWGEDPGNDRRYLPHRYTADSVVYTGTHDNDTTLGWWAGAPEPIRRHVRDYLACGSDDVGWTFIRAACASVAAMALYPMQDVLRLGSGHRMNTPATASGNWAWRFSWEQVGAEHAALLARFADLYGRGPYAPGGPAA